MSLEVDIFPRASRKEYISANILISICETEQRTEQCHIWTSDLSANKWVLFKHTKAVTMGYAAILS